MSQSQRIKNNVQAKPVIEDTPVMFSTGIFAKQKPGVLKLLAGAPELTDTQGNRIVLFDAPSLLNKASVSGYYLTIGYNGKKYTIKFGELQENLNFIKNTGPQGYGVNRLALVSREARKSKAKAQVNKNIAEKIGISYWFEIFSNIGSSNGAETKISDFASADRELKRADTRLHTVSKVATFYKYTFVALIVLFILWLAVTLLV